MAAALLLIIVLLVTVCRRRKGQASIHAANSTDKMEAASYTTPVYTSPLSQQRRPLSEAEICEMELERIASGAALDEPDGTLPPNAPAPVSSSPASSRHKAKNQADRRISGPLPVATDATMPWDALGRPTTAETAIDSSQPRYQAWKTASVEPAPSSTTPVDVRHSSFSRPLGSDGGLIVFGGQEIEFFPF